jgi:hypothetical protein
MEIVANAPSHSFPSVSSLSSHRTPMPNAADPSYIDPNYRHTLERIYTALHPSQYSLCALACDLLHSARNGRGNVSYRPDYM